MRKIAFICQPEYFRFCYEHDLDDKICVREFTFHYEMVEEDFIELENFSADYNIFFRGEFFPDTVLNRLSGIKINLSSEPFPRIIDNKLKFTFDSLCRYLIFREIRQKKFDYLFHYDQASVSFMLKDGLQLSGVFAFPVATSTYTPAEKAYDWDLFFIGRSTSHRERYFGKLKHHYRFLHIAHGVWGPSLVEYLNRSAICLNIHAENEVSWEPRMQMLLSAGAFVISQKITPNPTLRSGIDFVEVDSPKQLQEAVKYYLVHRDERMVIANQGCQRVREQLAASVSFPKLFDDIENGKIDPFVSSNCYSRIDMLAKIFFTIHRIFDLFSKIK